MVYSPSRDCFISPRNISDKPDAIKRVTVIIIKVRIISVAPLFLFSNMVLFIFLPAFKHYLIVIVVCTVIFGELVVSVTGVSVILIVTRGCLSSTLTK